LKLQGKGSLGFSANYFEGVLGDVRKSRVFIKFHETTPPAPPPPSPTLPFVCIYELKENVMGNKQISMIYNLSSI
jgi:hypothetical protein